MPTYEEIVETVIRIEGLKKKPKSREIKELPNILLENEQIERSEDINIYSA